MALFFRLPALHSKDFTPDSQTETRDRGMYVVCTDERILDPAARTVGSASQRKYIFTARSRLNMMNNEQSGDSHARHRTSKLSSQLHRLHRHQQPLHRLHRHQQPLHHQLRHQRHQAQSPRQPPPPALQRRTTGASVQGGTLVATDHRLRVLPGQTRRQQLARVGQVCDVCVCVCACSLPYTGRSCGIGRRGATRRRNL